MTGTSKVSSLEDHPVRVQERVHRLSATLEKVRFSQNINDLARARTVSMTAIWACLEKGEIVSEHVNRNDLGIYGKLRRFVVGQNTTVDFMIDADGVLNVLYASTDEED